MLCDKSPYRFHILAIHLLFTNGHLWVTFHLSNWIIRWKYIVRWGLWYVNVHRCSFSLRRKGALDRGWHIHKLTWKRCSKRGRWRWLNLLLPHRAIGIKVCGPCYSRLICRSTGPVRVLARNMRRLHIPFWRQSSLTVDCKMNSGSIEKVKKRSNKWHSSRNRQPCTSSKATSWWLYNRCANSRRENWPNWPIRQTVNWSLLAQQYGIMMNK